MTAAEQTKKVKHQTGPKTERGKRHSARNALRHGLSIPLMQDEKYRNRIRQITDAIVGQDHDLDRFTLARDIAEALLDIERIRNYQMQSQLTTREPRTLLHFGDANCANLRSRSSEYLVRAYGRFRSSIKRFDHSSYPNGRSLLQKGVEASGVDFDRVVKAKDDLQ